MTSPSHRSNDNQEWPEGRRDPRHRGAAALSRSTTQGIRQRMDCECGKWQFRDVVVTAAVAAIERHCPKCRRPMLLIYRGPDPVTCVPLLGGRHAGRLGASLRSAGLSRSEVQLLVTVAELMAC